MGEQERRKHILIHMIHQNNALARQLLKVRWEQRSARTKGLDNSLGEIQVMVFIAERLLMPKLQPVTNALMKAAIRALLGTDGDAAVQEQRGGSEKSQIWWRAMQKGQTPGCLILGTLPLQTLSSRSLCSLKQSMGTLCSPLTFWLGVQCSHLSLETSASIPAVTCWQLELSHAMDHQQHKHRLLSLHLSCRYSYCLHWSCPAASCCEDMPLSPCLRAKTAASEQRQEFLGSLGVVFSLVVFSPVPLCSAAPKGTKQGLGVAAQGGANSKHENHDLQSIIKVAPIPTITAGI